MAMEKIQLKKEKTWGEIKALLKYTLYWQGYSEINSSIFILF